MKLSLFNGYPGATLSDGTNIWLLAHGPNEILILDGIPVILRGTNGTDIPLTPPDRGSAIIGIAANGDATWTDLGIAPTEGWAFFMGFSIILGAGVPLMAYGWFRKIIGVGSGGDL